MTSLRNLLSFRPPNPRASIWWLVVLLLLSEGVYLGLCRASFFKDEFLALRFVVLILLAFLLYGAAWVLARSMSGQSRSALFVIIAGALLFRITLLDIGINSCSSTREMLSAVRSDLRGESLGYRRFVLFDDDVWRYLWDGHVSAAGLNPYQFPPNAPELDGLSRPESPSRLWTEIRARVNHPDLSTVYPPLAQLVFRFACWVAPGSVLAFKCIACLLDLIAAIFIALTLRALKYPMTSVMLYAWNPLVLTMIAGSGHIDALVAATIAATAYFVVRKNREMAAICFALSVLGKIAPIILIFLMMKRLHWKGTLLAVLVLIGMYLPYSSGGVAWRSLFFFAYTWQFNSGWFHLMERLMSFLSSDPSYAARIISGVIILALAIRLALRDKGTVESFLSAAATTLGASVVLSPTIMPWYVVGLLPLAVISKQRIWIYFSALVCLSVFMMADWRPHASVLIAEYGTFALMILFSAVLSYLARANLVHPDTLAMRYLRFSVNDDRQ